MNCRLCVSKEKFDDLLKENNDLNEKLENCLVELHEQSEFREDVCCEADDYPEKKTEKEYTLRNCFSFVLRKEYEDLQHQHNIGLSIIASQKNELEALKSIPKGIVECADCFDFPLLEKDCYTFFRYRDMVNLGAGLVIGIISTISVVSM